MTTASYTHLRANLAAIWDEVESTQEPVVIQRRGHQDMALIPAEELAGLLETAHLLRSPRNAERLLTALERSGQGVVAPTSLGEVRRSLGLPSD